VGDDLLDARLFLSGGGEQRLPFVADGATDEENGSVQPPFETKKPGSQVEGNGNERKHRRSEGRGVGEGPCKGTALVVPSEALREVVEAQCRSSGETCRASGEVLETISVLEAFGKVPSVGPGKEYGGEDGFDQ
jgi:hypothetical protein